MKYKQNSFSLLAIILAVSTCANAADVGVVIIGNPAASPLTKEQITEIYLGKSQSSVPLDQTESSPIRAVFYDKATGRSLQQIKATWSRLRFSGKAVPPKELPDAAAVKKAVAADPNAVGYIDKSAVDSTVKVLLTLD